MRYLPLFFLTLSLSTCTFTGLVLSQGDRLILWYLDDYFDLNGVQTQAAKKYLSEYWFRIRCDQSLRFQMELNQIADQSLNTAAPIFATNVENFLNVWKIRVLRPMLPFASKFLTSMTSEQWQNFNEEMQDKMKSLREKIALPPQEYLEAREESSRDRLEQFYGSIKDNDFLSVKPLLMTPQKQLAHWLTLRESRLTTMLKFFRQKPAERKIYQRLDQWLMEPDELVEPKLRPGSSKLRKKWYQKMAEINSRMPRLNRIYFSKYLKSFGQDIAESKPESGDCQAAGFYQMQKPG